MSELFDELKTLGADIEDGMDRFMGNEDLYRRMLFKFTDMIEKQGVSPDFTGGENGYEDVIAQAHAIKGATGNLALTPLYKAYTEIVNLLREGKPEPAREVLVKALPIQTAVIRCIEKYK